MLTLWATKDEPAQEFDKNRNVGLHHIALAVTDEPSLHRLYEHLRENQISFEFSSESLGAGPAKHMMCFEPSGIRVEFIRAGA